MEYKKSSELVQIKTISENHSYIPCIENWDEKNEAFKIICYNMFWIAKWKLAEIRVVKNEVEKVLKDLKEEFGKEFEVENCKGRGTDYYCLPIIINNNKYEVYVKYSNINEIRDWPKFYRWRKGRV